MGSSKSGLHLAQWLSPKFAVLVTNWVHDWVSGKFKAKAELPYHIRRYMANRSEIPHTHFSVLNEIIFNLIAPLEEKGYTLPEKFMPDASEGRMFCGWLRKKGIEPNDFPVYDHRFEDGRVYPAKLYPNELLAEFRQHFNEVWIPQKALEYFKKRDIKALSYLSDVFMLTDSQINPKKSLSKKVKDQIKRTGKKVKNVLKSENS